jgi:hypothetical protein
LNKRIAFLAIIILLLGGMFFSEHTFFYFTSASTPTIATLDSSSASTTPSVVAETSYSITGFSTAYPRELLIAHVCSNSTTITISDSAGLAWNTLLLNSGTDCYIWYAIMTSGNTLNLDTITLSVSTGHFTLASGFLVASFVGVQLSSPFDGGVAQKTVSAATSGTVQVTTSFANDLVLTINSEITGSSGGQPSISGYTLFGMTPATFRQVQGAYALDQPTATYTITWNYAANANSYIFGLALQSINQTPSSNQPNPISSGMDFYFWVILGIIDFALTFVGLVAILGEGEPKIWGIVLIIVAAPLSFFLAVNSYNLIYVQNDQAVSYGGLWPFAFVYWGIAGLDMLFFFVGIIKSMQIRRSFANKMRRFANVE